MEEKRKPPESEPTEKPTRGNDPSQDEEIRQILQGYVDDLRAFLKRLRKRLNFWFV
jgi:hypothetical protein